MILRARCALTFDIGLRVRQLARDRAGENAPTTPQPTEKQEGRQRDVIRHRRRSMLFLSHPRISSLGRHTIRSKQDLSGDDGGGDDLAVDVSSSTV
jgi:hypothetical protein